MDDDIRPKTFAEKLAAHANEIGALTADGAATSAAAERIKAEIEAKANEMRSSLAEQRATTVRQRQERIAAAKARVEKGKSNAGAAEKSFLERTEELQRESEPKASKDEAAAKTPDRESLQNWSEFLSSSKSFAQSSNAPIPPTQSESDSRDSGKKPPEGESWSNFIEL